MGSPLDSVTPRRARTSPVADESSHTLSNRCGLAQCWEFTGFLLLSWKHCVASEESLCLPVLFIFHTVKLKGIVPAF